MNIFFFIFMFYNLYLFSQDKIENELNSEDSIAYYDLPQFEVLEFKNHEDRVLYNRLKRRVLKVYPYVIVIKNKLNQIIFV